MTTSEMQEKIKRIIDSEYGIRAFAVLNTDDHPTIVKFLLDDTLSARVKGILEQIIRANYLQEDTILESAENIDDNRKALYEIIQSDDYAPFAFLNTYSSVVDAYSEGKIDQIMGFAFRINVNDTAIWLYQQIVYPQLIKRSKNLYAILSGNSVYTPLDKDILKIENKVDCLIIDTSVITSNISLMQRIFQFENYVRGEAIKTIDLISGMSIVDNMDKFIALEERKALTNAKKLMNARNSPVLRMDKSVLLSKLGTLPRYKDKFVFEDGKIKISNQKQATDFLKMLNDSILKSELTEAEYDSTVKTELTPLVNQEA